MGLLCAGSESVILPLDHNYSKYEQSNNCQQYDAAHDEEYLVLNDSRGGRSVGWREECWVEGGWCDVWSVGWEEYEGW